VGQRSLARQPAGARLDPGSQSTGQAGGHGVRVIACYLPIKSPWLNAIEATWAHGKRRVVEADRLLTIHELADRVADAYDCPHEPHLVMPKKVA